MFSACRSVWRSPLRLTQGTAVFNQLHRHRHPGGSHEDHSPSANGRESVCSPLGAGQRPEYVLVTCWWIYVAVVWM